ncbi:MAG: hypothetical protein KatS3mg108_0831 [Isosphaeraceae bacterium]|jgi:anti-sigma B factor antagonist|nr:MAG: hypothetical protein KatS3mg108_0831 [Isosphaeraceae bacterium]
MSEPVTPPFRVTVRGPTTVVELLDREIVRDEAIDALAQQLNQLVEEGGHRDLLLDFGAVEFLSSAALSRLIQIKKKLSGVGGRLRLCAMEPDLREVFRITRLDTVFEILRDAESALSRP